jgi:crotonobetainyl-CoA:carnitine CoA-transferase CaiB-like acyl-CoA transferase
MINEKNLNEGTLNGIRVLDFSRYIAGPYCAGLLAYLGADVIRVEKPSGGEDRFIAPISEGSSPLLFMTGNRKRSLGLDLKSPEAAEIIKQLVAHSDVVIANMSPASLRRLGLDYETLISIKPNIILTTQTCFGHKGPWADRGGFDGIGQAMSGAAFMSGFPDEPRRSIAPYVDYSTAVLGAFGTLAAIRQREQTGEGQHVQASLLGSAIAAFSTGIIEQEATQANRIPTGNRGQTGAPTDIFKASNGSVITQVVGEGLFRRVTKVIGETEWNRDPRFLTDKLRGDNRDVVCEAVGKWIAERTVEEVIEIFAIEGVPCGPVLNLADAASHPQVDSMGFLEEVGFPNIEGTIKTPRVPLDFSGYDPMPIGPPQVGEHSVEILREVGFSEEDVTVLMKKKIVGA